MDSPPPARAATQAVEARPQGLRGNAPTRTVTVGGRSGRLPRTTLVASRRQAGSGRPYHPLLRPTGSAQTCRLTSTFRTAGGGPACPVVWQGSSGAPLPPMPIGNIHQRRLPQSAALIFVVRCLPIHSLFSAQVKP